MFKTILVPTDGSDLAEKAIKAAIDFAKVNNGKVIGLSVAEPYPFSPLGEAAFLPDPDAYETGMQELAELNVQKIAMAADKANVPFATTTTLSFNPAEAIVETAAKYGCDVIFMASHGRRGIDRLLLGSVTQKVLVHSSIPVMVFR